MHSISKHMNYNLHIFYNQLLCSAYSMALDDGELFALIYRDCCIHESIRMTSIVLAAILCNFREISQKFSIRLDIHGKKSRKNIFSACYHQCCNTTQTFGYLTVSICVVEVKFVTSFRLRHFMPMEKQILSLTFSFSTKLTFVCYSLSLFFKTSIDSILINQ